MSPEQAFAAWYEGKKDLRGYTTEDGFLAGYAAAARPIPVTERLPEYRVEVLVFFSGVWQVAKRIPGKDCADWWLGQWELRGVTHWLELPPIPTKEPTP